MLLTTNTWDRLGKLQDELDSWVSARRQEAALNPSMRHIQVKTGLAKILMQLGILTRSKRLTSMRQSKEKDPFKG